MERYKVDCVSISVKTLLFVGIVCVCVCVLIYLDGTSLHNVSSTLPSLSLKAPVFKQDWRDSWTLGSYSL